jgi:hypothetical protein
VKTCYETREFLLFTYLSYLFMFEKTFKNLNWSIVGLQTLVVVICMKIAEMAWLDRTLEALLLPSSQIALAIIILLFLRKNIRGSFGSLELFIGGNVGFYLTNQPVNLFSFCFALIAIWLLEANEARLDVLSKKNLLLTSACLMACCGLVLYFFGIESEKWILSALIGWTFQLTCLLGKPFEWDSTPSGGIWFPVEKHNPNLWIIAFFFANLGLLGLRVVIGNFNLALILVLGKIVQKDRSGRWISITRLIAVFLVILPEVLQNLLQFLLQYY